MLDTSEFDQLMANVMAGSEDAIWQLAEIYTPYIIRAVRRTLPRRLRSKLGSQDFAQTLWASLLVKRADFTRLQTHEELVAYLARATKNKVIDKARHFRTQRYDFGQERQLVDVMPGTKERDPSANPAGLYDRDPTPSTAAIIRERWHHVQSILSDRDRTILRMRLEGRTYDDISSELHIHSVTVQRATQRLFELLSG